MVGKKGGWDARMHSTGTCGILKAGGSGDSQPTVTVLEDVAELPARHTVN
jgi:hypothetical protein